MHRLLFCHIIIVNFKTKEPSTHPSILDFDLDGFASGFPDGNHVIVWSETIFHERNVSNYKVKDVMDCLIDKAALITICREPGGCGDIGESKKILYYSDHCFFNGGLRTQPID